MELVSSFMDEDGTFNLKWLDIAISDDIRAALDGKTNEQLQSICDLQGWKVLQLFSR